MRVCFLFILILSFSFVLDAFKIPVPTKIPVDLCQKIYVDVPKGKKQKRLEDAMQNYITAWNNAKYFNDGMPYNGKGPADVFYKFLVSSRTFLALLEANNLLASSYLNENIQSFLIRLISKVSLMEKIWDARVEIYLKTIKEVTFDEFEDENERKIYEKFFNTIAGYLLKVFDQNIPPIRKIETICAHIKKQLRKLGNENKFLLSLLLKYLEDLEYARSKPDVMPLYFRFYNFLSLRKFRSIDFDKGIPLPPMPGKEIENSIIISAAEGEAYLELYKAMLNFNEAIKKIKEYNRRPGLRRKKLSNIVEVVYYACLLFIKHFSEVYSGCYSKDSDVYPYFMKLNAYTKKLHNKINSELYRFLENLPAGFSGSPEEEKKYLLFRNKILNYLYTNFDTETSCRERLETLLSLVSKKLKTLPRGSYLRARLKSYKYHLESLKDEMFCGDMSVLDKFIKACKAVTMQLPYGAINEPDAFVLLSALIYVLGDEIATERSSYLESGPGRTIFELLRKNVYLRPIKEIIDLRKRLGKY